MAYKRLTTMDILEIQRRINQGQSIKHISRCLGYDRKTIRKYIQAIRNHPNEDAEKIIREINPELKGRPSEKQNMLEPFTLEIDELLNEKGLKAKTAYEVVCEKHDLSGKLSYSSFKRFIKSNKLTRRIKSTCRQEYEPGSQVQIDYCKVGLMQFGISGKKKTVYAFIGTLSYSRHKYVEFVYSQDQMSFVQSHINMFNYFGGVPVTVKPDNLKSGVIKPDLYDPKINRAYAEMAEHYGIFIDPARIASPKDKPIVERDVQTVREQFKKMQAINALINITEANHKIREWLIIEYGTRKHGTTQLLPYSEFISIERPLLLPHPGEEYEISEWKTAKVHPDHFIQVNKKAYSLPEQYIGKEVMVKIQQNTIHIYYNDEFIKQYTIPQGYRQTDITDFPEHMHHRLDTGMPFYLRKQAHNISPLFGELITKVLTPNAYLNLRRAQSILRIAGEYSPAIITEASITALENYSTVHPKLFRAIIEKHLEITQTEEQLVLSMETEGFVRDPSYFTN